MNIAAISLTPHDCSLCILKDGEVYEYILEERLSTHKHDGKFFFSAKKLSEFEKTYGLDKIYIVNGSENDCAHTELCLSKYDIDSSVEEIFDEHHLYHASSAYYSSGFDEAICLVMDGMGAGGELEKIIKDLGKFDDFNQEDLLTCSEGNTLSETTSVYYVKNNNFKSVYRNYFISPENYPPIDKEYLSTISQSDLVDLNPYYDIGAMYGTITKHLGFERHECGKTMGLASYGKEDPELPSFVNHTKLSGNSNIFCPSKWHSWVHPSSLLHHDDFQKKANIAYKLQKTVEDVIISRVGKILEKYPNTKNLAFSGGVALNICANSAIKRTYPDLNLFIDPVASDACQAYGAAKYYYNQINKEMKNNPLETIYLGSNYNLKFKKTDIQIAVAKENKKRYNTTRGNCNYA